AAGTSAAPRPPATAPGTGPAAPQTPPTTPGKAYSPAQVCGAGYGVVDQHPLGGATVYLLYNAGNGNNCVTTIAGTPGGPVAMNATLTVKGGATAGNPGSFTYYAGPVTAHAANTCVQWGGSYQGASWTSGWSHCG
ncbi:spore-associated protein A, partial [Kitasatospora sp. MBT63]|uniref:spore-associated protein A n=2 Tax=unclassified Kitasatospora TaxID=2633591 RepID=UPI0018F3D1D7